MHFSKYNQQDATLYNIFYYCQYSTCFRRFLRPSSGAKNCTHRIGYISSLLAVTASVGESERLVVHGILQLTRRACSFTWIFSTELHQITTLSITYSHRSHLLRSSPMLWPLAWVSRSNSPTLAVTVSKLEIYPMRCVQFLSSWWWAEKPPETCRALTVIKNMV